MSFIEVGRNLKVSLSEIEFQYVRSSGPGGQKVNKSHTCAVLTWDLNGNRTLSDAQMNRLRKIANRRISQEGILSIRSDRYRHRGRNTADCLVKLQNLLQSIASGPKKRIATKPSKRQKEARLTDKKKHSEKKRMRSNSKYR